MSKKRKVDAEGQQFNERWENEYKPGDRLCDAAVAVPEESNLLSPFDTKHRTKYANFSHQEKQQKIQEWKGRLQSQQNMSTKVITINDFLVAEEITCSECFLEGSFMKQCMLKVCEQVYQD